MTDNYSMAKELENQLQREIDEKCVVTDWLKPLYDDLYNGLNQYGNLCVNQLRNEGYKVEFVSTSVGRYNYINSTGEKASKSVLCKIASISHVAPSGLIGDSELVGTWKKCITDKNNQVLLLYVPVAAGALFNTSSSYMTSFAVITLD